VDLEYQGDGTMGQSIEQFSPFLNSPHKPSQPQIALDRRWGTDRNQIAVGGLTVALVSLALIGIALSPDTLWAATINVASCSQTEVNAKVASAVDGDTVVIPAGTCTWTTQLTALGSAKAITIQGAGIDQTTIVDNVNKTGGGAETVLLPVVTALGKTFRLTGLTFMAQAQDSGSYNKGIVVVTGTSQNVRIDHVKFTQPGPGSWTGAIRIFGFVFGAIDHCTFNLPYGAQAVVVYHDAWNGATWGDGSFADALYLGTNKAIYIEDNTFLGLGIAGKGAVDSVGGGRFVFRYNKVTNENLATHGTESGGRYRGVRSYEIYNNIFSTSTEMSMAILLRGGTGVVFGNSSVGYTTLVTVSEYRAATSYAPWGKCDGSSAYDGNSLANGYPCIDQVGWGSGNLMFNDNPPSLVAWPQQVLTPLYIWGNTYAPTTSQYAKEVSSQHSAWIVAGREYTIGTAKPGYSPYIYPHPLVSGSTNSNPPPAPPQNLAVK